MGATINPNKLKFSIFGNGFDDTRNDSGFGNVTYQKRIGYGASTAVIDENEEFFWITQSNGQLPFNYLGKGKISDLESVEITTIPTDTATKLYHASNVANNFGIAFQNFGANCDIYVFDLSTDEVFKHFTANLSFLADITEVVKNGDDFYFVERGQTNGNVYKLDYANETFTLTGSRYMDNGKACGFVDVNTVYGFNNPVWFSDYKWRFGFTYNGSDEWAVRAPNAGSSGFQYCIERGLCGNGYFWVPCYIDGAWRWGKFDGNSSSDFVTPSPITTFGEFGSDPSYDDYHFYYNDGRTWCAYVQSGLGMMLTNFDSIFSVTTEYWRPLAVSDHFVIAQDRYIGETDIFKFR